MHITPVSMNTNCHRASVQFKGSDNQEAKPLIDIDPATPGNRVVAYGTWGSNYVYPITADQVRAMNAERRILDSMDAKRTQYENTKEDEAEYLKRKLYRTEWTT